MDFFWKVFTPQGGIANPGNWLRGGHDGTAGERDFAIGRSVIPVRAAEDHVLVLELCLTVLRRAASHN
jgi:hypothetical protein